MRRSIQEIREEMYLEIEALQEDMRKARYASPWELLILFGMGAGFSLVVIVVGTWIMRQL
ncbi:hypothetical protein [Pseudomonas putida]|uniref:Uncharacterized protein n=1 Tax=Pseudomonas putida TaxID=303 RepID=A0A6I6Y1T6_PSEPU|nr:hypothetical protein [Pseudomonas putida]QHG66191.1 hypothetical protein C2H86_18055 [Pseudomonas putida]